MLIFRDSILHFFDGSDMNLLELIWIMLFYGDMFL